MSSSGLLYQFFHRKRRRSRSPVVTTIDSTTRHDDVHDVDQTQKQSPWKKRRAYYRRCHQLALQDPSIGILQRHSQEANVVVAPSSPTPMTSYVDPWTRTLPYWLLMLPLYIHVDSMAHTSYAQLLAYTRALEKERNGLYQDYIKVQDRYRRFVQHVKKRTVQWDRDKSGKENKAAAAAAPVNDNANSTRGIDMTTVEVPKPKTKSRRVTASPGRIRPEPVETRHEAPNHPPPPIALHPPQHEAYPAALASHIGEAKSSQPRLPDKIPSPIRSTELNKLSTSNQSLSSKDKREQIPLIPVRGKNDTTNHEDDSETVIPSQQPVEPDGSGFPPSSSTATVQSDRRQQHDHEESTGVSLHATKQGWISSRLAKAFVANNADQPLQVVQQNSRPIQSAPHALKGLTTREAKLSIQPSTRIANPRPPPTGPYCEVVRKKAERQALKPYPCTECGKFIDAILEEDKEGVYNRHELMCASRHRHRFTPPDTPPDFWELSFIDERDGRLQQEQPPQQDKATGPTFVNEGPKSHANN